MYSLLCQCSGAIENSILGKRAPVIDLTASSEIHVASILDQGQDIREHLRPAYVKVRKVGRTILPSLPLRPALHFKSNFQTTCLALSAPHERARADFISTPSSIWRILLTQHPVSNMPEGDLTVSTNNRSDENRNASNNRLRRTSSYEERRAQVDEICRAYAMQPEDQISLLHTVLYLTHPIKMEDRIGQTHACLSTQSYGQSTTALLRILLRCVDPIKSGFCSNALQFAFAVAIREGGKLFSRGTENYALVIALGALIYLCEPILARHHVFQMGFREDEATVPGEKDMPLRKTCTHRLNQDHGRKWFCPIAIEPSLLVLLSANSFQVYPRRSW
ncbi:hypothetical protein K491DRAFT_194335 [Lophiostoma macrostomum CBS 122681]|uniref:Uncharacterized protein n=1 Tax=Lophiostoma macrostomum CBS 122681 TaxID=1314788 RepID=A0A6A6TJB4_9PLEO|nr:hypothetical protein K491DRAFT_194335 [Lophiostoma macrostomum CBS 122681]